MDILTARQKIFDFYAIPAPTEEERFQYTEAMEFLLEQNFDPGYLTEYGGYYYGLKKFDLALKYYQMAADMGHVPAQVYLGYIWYYGRTGKIDYQKAFQCFESGMKHGSLVATYKVADMYKNGYYVQQDEAKYIRMIEDLYDELEGSDYLGDPVADVYARLARIRTAQGRREEAVELFLQAKDFLRRRLAQDAFFGELNVMEWLVRDLYQLVEFDETEVDLFDLYYLFRWPASVSFTYKRRKYLIEARQEGDDMVIYFDEKAFNSVTDLLIRARIGQTTLTAINYGMRDFMVEFFAKEEEILEEK